VTSSDLTLAEALEALQAFAASIGSKCEAHAGLNLHRRGGSASKLLTGQIYPMGLLGKVTLWPEGDTWRELLADCEARWAAHRALHESNIVRKMALAIIAITADQGECTDAALRAEFDPGDVARHGEAACDAATEMASNGPFTIIRMRGANAGIAA
jgi:hypothetical protein